MYFSTFGNHSPQPPYGIQFVIILSSSDLFIFESSGLSFYRELKTVHDVVKSALNRNPHRIWGVPTPEPFISKRLKTLDESFKGLSVRIKTKVKSSIKSNVTSNRAQ